MSSKFNIRCKYSQKGLNSMTNGKIRLRNQSLRGTIVRETRDKRCWVIIWDGNTSTDSGTSKKYIDLIRYPVIEKIITKIRNFINKQPQ